MLKKLLNDPFAAVDEMLEGYVLAHGDVVSLDSPRVLVRRHPRQGKVGVVIGGGAGHEPAFIGYVGHGMADAAAVGNVFASPSADVCLRAIKAASSGAGVLLAYGNYTGDVLNFDLAAKLAGAEGIDVQSVRVSDDIASAPRGEEGKRRGIAGGVLVFKLVGAAAEAGANLDEVERIGRKANGAIRSIGVALSSCQVPGSARPTFEIGPGEIEIGMGVHGEPGTRRGPLESADNIARTMVAAILADQPAGDGSELALLVNGLGATPYLDLYVLYRAARRELEIAGFSISRSLVGEFVTSLEMGGASITVMRLDDETRKLLDASAGAVRRVA